MNGKGVEHSSLLIKDISLVQRLHVPKLRSGLTQAVGKETLYLGEARHNDDISLTSSSLNLGAKQRERGRFFLPTHATGALQGERFRRYLRNHTVTQKATELVDIQL